MTEYRGTQKIFKYKERLYKYKELYAEDKYFRYFEKIGLDYYGGRKKYVEILRELLKFRMNKYREGEVFRKKPYIAKRRRMSIAHKDEYEKILKIIDFIEMKMNNITSIDTKCNTKSKNIFLCQRDLIKHLVDFYLEHGDGKNMIFTKDLKKNKVKNVCY